MSDTGSNGYDENIEVQESSGGGGGGGGGGDNYSVSSHGSHHHHRSHHYTTYSSGHHGYGRSHRRYGNKMLPGDGKAFKPCIICVCLVIITVGLVVFISSTVQDIRGAWERRNEPPTTPPPPKPWSGDFSGIYYRQANSGGWAKDSASTRNWKLKEVAELDGKTFYITKEQVVTGGNRSANASDFTTTYTITRELERGAQLKHNFTSGVSFTQKTTRKGKKLIKLNFNDEDFYWEEVPTTITVEQWAEADRGGKKGIWREVQHSNPEVRVKRIFFDQEMTAIFQSPAEHYVGLWDVYVVRYSRRKY